MSVSAFPYGTMMVEVAAPVITVTGGDDIFHAVANGNTATAKIHVRTVGTILKTEGVTQTQLQASTDWIIPNYVNDGLYEVMFTKGFLDDDPTGGDALDTWHFMDSNRSVEYVETSDDTQIEATITTHIRYNGGAEIDSGDNDLRATVGTPI